MRAPFFVLSWVVASVAAAQVVVAPDGGSARIDLPMPPPPPVAVPPSAGAAPLEAHSAPDAGTPPPDARMMTGPSAPEAGTPPPDARMMTPPSVLDAGTSLPDARMATTPPPADPASPADAGVDTGAVVSSEQLMDARKARLREFLPPGRVDGAALARARQTAESAPAMVVSGAISLGAYQAGFIATLARFWALAAKENPHAPFPGPRVWTGASAGASNALLGGLAGCDLSYAEPEWSPETTLFWELWVNELDLSRLLPTGAVASSKRTDHLFDAERLQVLLEKIEKRVSGTRFRPNCAFAFGLTTTNLSGRQIPFGTGTVGSKAQLERITERVVAQVYTDSSGKLAARLPFLRGTENPPFPHLEVDRAELAYYPALGGGEPTAGKRLDVRDVLRTPQASGGFPLAFPPVPLPLTYFDELSWKPIPGATYVDGGLLNNNPLDLAQRLGQRWREERPETFAASAFPIIYLDQDVTDWQWKDDPRAPSASPLIRTYLSNGARFIAAARDSVALSALEEDADLSRRIKIPRRSSVLPSEFRAAMLGFTDQTFREHDFYRGMLDAIRFLRTQYSSSDAVQRMIPGLTALTDIEAERQLRARLGITSKGFGCVADGICGQNDVPAHSPPPLFALRNATDAVTRIARDGQLFEDDLDQLLRALGEAGYRYSPGVLCDATRADCIASGTRSDLLPLRERIGDAVHDLITHQHPGFALAARPVATAWLDEWLTYSPPEHVILAHVSRTRGIGLGYETPVRGLVLESDRNQIIYERAELRVGGLATFLGTADTDQVVAHDLRLRMVNVSGYLDWVSDPDGFNGAIKWMALGPYLRWRAGLGVSVSYLSSVTGQDVGYAYHLPEVRLGLDIVERIGLRVSVPILVGRNWGEQNHVINTAKFYRDSAVGVDVLITGW